MATIDVSQQVAEMARMLRMREDPQRSREVLAILERWQWDAMLDAASRAQARQLLREFSLSIRWAGSLCSPRRPPSAPR